MRFTPRMYKHLFMITGRSLNHLSFAISYQLCSLMYRIVDAMSRDEAFSHQMLMYTFANKSIKKYYIIWGRLKMFIKRYERWYIVAFRVLIHRDAITCSIYIRTCLDDQTICIYRVSKSTYDKPTTRYNNYRAWLCYDRVYR